MGRPPLRKKRSSGIAQEVRHARNARGWSQAVLSQKSTVAPRTIVAVEAGDIPERGVIIRLASALQQDVQPWLRQCGYDIASDEEIHTVLRGSRQLHFAGEQPPDQYFQRLLERVRSGRKLFMFVAYLTPPAAPRRPVVKDILLSAMREGGLHIAMVCPYPRIADPATVAKPALSVWYANTFNRIVTFARELHEQLPQDRQGQVAVFAPNFPPDFANRLHIVPPPSGLAEYRPTLIFDATHEQAALRDDAAFELSAWFTMQEDGRDRWLPIFPPSRDDPDAVASAVEHLGYWRDYFGEPVIAAASQDNWQLFRAGNPDSLWRLEFPAN